MGQDTGICKSNEDANESSSVCDENHDENKRKRYEGHISDKGVISSMGGEDTH